MKFRKKPVVIEAVQFVGGKRGFSEDVPWLAQAILREEVRCHDAMGGVPDYALISTLEGTMMANVANVGDWIIRGVQGELYPCKPDIFAATYEPMEAP